ncbi:HIRAN domain-containing protein [Synechococcus sp. CCY9201]|uniref:HIRAN domain-containing protein n=1 Tax=Synechococcus sp. CCY9201 TaxID=174697 RepID=UPI002B1FBF90|nr:HIRAN domain-containing protein [Synechococcus sp. CCY9201]MEA5474272.1 HIRAN domain-containing protein [Synechococcus sp. CCY9201]
MAPKGNLFQRLQHLDDAGSAERQAARQRRQQQSSAEILQTFLAYRLEDAAEKMALGITIGDPLTLQHEPTNQWDPNAVKVFWREKWIGYIPKDMAALIAAEVPEARDGLEAVVTGLATTSRRDAFRLQIAIPIPRASRRLRELGVSSSFAWDVDRTSGSDKLRLVISCSEGAFRELQELLAASFDVSKCGYSYYPAQDGRHYPWYLSLTDASGRAPEDPDVVEQLIRSHFGVPSESTRVRERQERLKELEEKQEEISTRLETSRAEQRRLQREFDTSRSALERRAQKALAEGEQAIELAQSVEGELRQELDLKEQELQLALAEIQTLSDQLAQISTELEVNTLELDYFRQQSGSGGSGEFAVTPWTAADGGDGKAEDQEISDRLLMSLRRLAGSERLRPRQCLELVSEELCPGHLLVLDSAWRSADEAKGFEYGDRLFELLWLLATSFREQKFAGAPDLVAGQQAFGASSYAPRESQTIENNQQARRERTFSYGDKTIEMWQHLKIGVKDSENRTLRIHFCWDADLGQVVIGHCGRHLHVPGH